MRHFLYALPFLFPSMSHADISDLIRDQGLAAAQASLEQQSTRGPDDQFALGGVIFLRAIERAYQERWRVGFTDGDVPVPVLRAELPPNPSPEAFEATTVRDIFTRFLADMAASESVLSAIPSASDPAFSVALPDLWFDIDMNGSRGPTEGFTDIALQSLMSPWEIQNLTAQQENNPDPLQATIRFDRADLFWLRAYTQVLSGTAELVLAFDPTTEIEKVLQVQKAVASQFNQTQTGTAFGPDRVADQFSWAADILAVVIETLRHQPDQPRIAKARDHFLSMVRLNRVFWTELAAETDNTNEWIPNPTQTAALGFDMPQAVDQAWLAVLSDMERVLQGNLLVPYWRFAPSFGINIQTYVDNPAPVPLVEWIQGSAALPYAEQGDVMTTENWRDFRSLVRQQTGLFVILLN